MMAKDQPIDVALSDVVRTGLALTRASPRFDLPPLLRVQLRVGPCSCAVLRAVGFRPALHYRTTLVGAFQAIPSLALANAVAVTLVPGAIARAIVLTSLLAMPLPILRAGCAYRLARALAIPLGPVELVVPQAETSRLVLPVASVDIA